MDLNPIILSIPIYFILIAIEWIYDAIQKKGLYRLGDAFSNIGCGIFEQATGVFAKVFTVGLYAVSYDYFRIFSIPTTFISVFILWICVDFTYYWAHRWSHEINLFWIGHAIHHQSEDYNFSVALRQGALQKLFTAPIYIPLAIIGFSPKWFLFVSALNTIYQFWIHTQTIKTMGWLELIFNTPSHHRVHHGKNPKYIDKNHAGSLIIWDKLFGTFQPEEETPVYGITRSVNTFNPIKAHLYAIRDLIIDVKSQKGFNKLKAIFYKPGWAERDKIQILNTTKFDFNFNKRFTPYFWLQSFLLLTFSAYFLFTYTEATQSIKIASAIIISANLFSLGTLYESENSGLIFELIRWIANPLLLYLSHVHATTLQITFILSTTSITYLIIIAYSKYSKIGTKTV